MTGAQELFIALVVLYLFECVLVLRRDVIVFRSLGFGRFRAIPAGNLPGSPERALFFSMPAPPLGGLYLTEQSPISLSPTGISTRRAEHFGCESEALEPAEFRSYAKIEQIAADGPALKINDEIAERLCGPVAARALAAEIDVLRNAPDAAGRDRLIERALDARFDIDAAAAKRETTEREAGTLLMLCNALCVYLFTIVPLVVWRSGLDGTWAMLLIALAGLWGSIAAEFVRVHRRLDPDASADRRHRFAIICCTPLSAVRAYEWLLRERLAAFHALAVAIVTCEKADAAALAGAMLRDLEYPCRRAAAGVAATSIDQCDASGESELRSREDENAEADEAAAWLRSRLRDRVIRLMRRLELDVAGALAAPLRDDADSVAYCPRCHTQFVRQVADCAHCPGVAVRAFENVVTEKEPVEVRS
ncbi:MAG: hypothetical protein JNG88_15305 [Phycisphaerales bacterium]|nr:hypothetical protein [Phycisphaerales bacterium]